MKTDRVLLSLIFAIAFIPKITAQNYNHTPGILVGWGDQGIPYVPQSTRFTAIAAGASHSLALKSDGTGLASGYNGYGQIAVPTGLMGVIAIAAGGLHSLALKSDGTVVAWGYNGSGESTVPNGLNRVVAIAAGGYHSLALKNDGTVVAWGANQWGQSTVPANLFGITAIAAGGDQSHQGSATGGFSLALKSDGTVVAWGDNRAGECSVPTNLTGVTAIAAGDSHGLALKSDGTVVAWGYNFNGESTVPNGLNGVVAIAAGAYHSLALKSNGTIVAWGANIDGQCKVPANLTSTRAIAAGDFQTLALKSDGTVVAWGDYYYGGYTYSANTSDPETTVPTGLSGTLAVSTGGYYNVGVGRALANSLTLKSDGTVFAWGNNYGTVPANLIGVTAVAAGSGHSLALKSDGTVVAWGDNSFGMSTVPTALNEVVAIAAGDLHSLALKSDGTVVAWGNNAYGESTVPAGLNAVVAIAVGGVHCLALKSDGTVVAWGENNYGESTVPANLTNVIAVAAGGYHSLALKSDGTVVAWGDNNDRQNYYAGQSTVPANLTGVIAIAAGGYHSLALKSDGTVVAWGSDSFGELAVPTGLKNVVAIAAGMAQSLAVVALSNQSPSILGQPMSQHTLASQSVTFTVFAAGTPPLSYQWQFNGNNIAGANAASLVLNGVTAASSGGYSVVISSPYGFVLSTTAYLSVLADGANGIQPLQMPDADIPAQPSGIDSLVVITHGFEPLQPNADLSWLTKICDLIRARVPSNWLVTDLTWLNIHGVPAAILPDPDAALIAGVIVGRSYGKQLAQQQWKHVHLIGHSAGAAVIEAIAQELATSASPPVIHETFLDPYTEFISLEGQLVYGANADWADSYFVDDSTGASTGGGLVNAFNVDVTWVDPFHTTTPIPCPSTTDDSTPPFLDNVCSYQAWSTHGYPVDFYSNSIAGLLPAYTTPYGFSMSKEGNGWNNRNQYPNNPDKPVILKPVVLGNPSALYENQLPTSIWQLPQITIMPTSTSAFGAGYIGTSAFSLVADDPSWLSMAVTVTNPVNFVQFNAAFGATNSTQGLLTVYWNTNQIGMMDERIAKVGTQSYHFRLPGMVDAGLYTLSFRLDAFNSMTSSIVITNLTMGLTGFTQPVTLGMSLGTNGFPLLRITGTSGYYYLLQSSTNLVDWSLAALLVNTNGVMLFTTPSPSKGESLFYRVLLPN